MKKLLTIALILCTLTSSAQMRGGSQYDPGSIRANGTGPYADYLKFDATAEMPDYAEGRLFWDKDNGCLGVYPDVNGPILQVGQEFWARVKNPGVATITNGTVVYLDPPTTGKDPVAKLAQANASDTACMLGVVTHDISPDSTGFVTIQGLVRDLHNSEFTEGQRVYLSATTAGSYTASVPAAPNFPVKVGHVVKAHDGAGVLYIKQQLNGAFERAQFASTISTATGTAATPAYSFGSDPDTGIYSAGADTLGFGEGGAESMRITSGGNVLIATSTDDGSNKLQVNGDIVATKGTFIANLNTTYGLRISGLIGAARNIFLAGQQGVSNGFTVRSDNTNMFYNFELLREFADNAAAAAGGLGVGDIYHTGGILKIRIP